MFLPHLLKGDDDDMITILVFALAAAADWIGGAGLGVAG
jgi:hypothetical protein